MPLYLEILIDHNGIIKNFMKIGSAWDSYPEFVLELRDFHYKHKWHELNYFRRDTIDKFVNSLAIKYKIPGIVIKIQYIEDDILGDIDNDFMVKLKEI